MQFLRDADFDFDQLRRSPLGGGEPRGGEYTGTKALMLAVLENGFASYFSPKVRIRAEAERWITSTRRWTPFSFNIVCETLGLEPEAVRLAVRRLRALQNGSAPVLKRTRPNVRARRVSM